MTQGLKNLQDSNAYKKAGAMANATHEKAAGLWSTMTSSPSFQSISVMAGNVNKAVGAATATAKTKISQSISQQGGGDSIEKMWFGARFGASFQAKTRAS